MQTERKGFKLSIDKTGKDQGKANYANAYIGFGQSHSSFNRNGEGKVQDALGEPTGFTTEKYSVWGNLDNI